MMISYSEILIISLDFSLCPFNNKIIVDLSKDIKIRYTAWGRFSIYRVLGTHVISRVCLHDNMPLISMWPLITRKWNTRKLLFWSTNTSDTQARIGLDHKYILIIYLHPPWLSILDHFSNQQKCHFYLYVQRKILLNCFDVLRKC